jgi:hypothetical protein
LAFLRTVVFCPIENAPPGIENHVGRPCAGIGVVTGADAALSLVLSLALSCGACAGADAGEPPFALEFHPGGDPLVDSLRDECPALVVIGLRGRRGTAVGALIRRIKSWCPQLPVVLMSGYEKIVHASEASPT